MTDPFGRILQSAALLLVVAATAAGCGKVEKLEQPIRPSLEVFASKAQPVFERIARARAARAASATESSPTGSVASS